jgi:RNA polymerase sigma factor for flagellar operon FliA
LSACIPSPLTASRNRCPPLAQAPEALLINREQIGYLHDALAELPERLRTVVELYYFHRRPLADIAGVLGVTEPRISQLRSEGVALLRAALHAADADHRPAAPPGRRAARTNAYAQAVSARSSVIECLQATSLLGEPRPLLARAS